MPRIKDTSKGVVKSKAFDGVAYRTPTVKDMEDYRTEFKLTEQTKPDDIERAKTLAWWLTRLNTDKETYTRDEVDAWSMTTFKAANTEISELIDPVKKRSRRTTK